MPSGAENPAIAHDQSADHWVGRGETNAAAGKPQSDLHIVQIRFVWRCELNKAP
jgi:hypothetical protein